MFHGINCTHKEDFSLKEITTFGIGGPCSHYLIPHDLKAVQQIVEECKLKETPFLTLGNGSNVLFNDEGFKGVIIHVGKGLKGYELQDGRIIAESGLMMPKLSVDMSRLGITGFEFMAGIPGTIGGAVVMNAGCIGKETSDVLLSVTYLNSGNEIVTEQAIDVELSFRSSKFHGKTDLVILQAEFAAVYSDKEEVMEQTKKAANIRKGKFPLNVATVGSTFKSPPEGPHPGRLVEEVGLKGYTIGGAQISPVHANWIINIGGATAKDVLQLMDLMQNKVMQKLGIQIEPEVIIV